ncbi:oxidoreductase-like protein [Amylocarpus encephaloides]|uniref:Oxidoreductase-like protein n=1 Tax=Amylocarpus encephaloides TaxID=45428 RepID=A0A9P7YSW2_9HELO|nr:oxidoreductase-like protein [Amylocarpus encephaloides]
MSFYQAETAWHEGEQEMHKLLRVPEHDNPTSPMLTPFAAQVLRRSPLLALGALDSEGRPWTSLWGGENGFSRAIAQSIVGVRTVVDRIHDPVVDILLSDLDDGEEVQVQGTGKMVGMLTIDLETRRRVKLYGRMVGRSFQSTLEGVGDIQLVVKIEQSLGNCPKYLNKKHITPHIPQPKLASSGFPLSDDAVDVISKSDLFFISSSHHDSDMDTNHRGGPPGFVRILSNDKDGLSIVYPEYSGNRLYQTLGNLRTTPKAGLAFPNFETGDVVYVTGKTEILTGKDALSLIGHTNLAVKINVEAVRIVSDGLAFRGQTEEYSPYNPPVRYLTTEKEQSVKENNQQMTVTLIDKKIISPTIARFRFQIADPKEAGQWKPGQHAALSFADDLDIGYSHMRDDDPQSLNDDFLRTFTISSRPEASNYDQFEITARKVGVVTDFLFKSNIRAGLDIGLQGFGGQFYIEQDEGERVSFVASGVGITPLLPQASDLDLKRLDLYWTIRGDDLALVNDAFQNIPGLAERTHLFVTGRCDEDSVELKRLNISPVKLQKRRMTKEDLSSDTASKWYLCTGSNFRNTLMVWLEGKPTFYEDFNY